MPQVRMVQWRVGLLKITVTQLQQHYTTLGLAAAKQRTDRLVRNEMIAFDLEDDAVARSSPRNCKRPVLLKLYLKLIDVEQQVVDVMDEQQLLERIIRDPHVPGVKPVIKGTTIGVEHVLGLLAQGATVDQVVNEH